MKREPIELNDFREDVFGEQDTLAAQDLVFNFKRIHRQGALTALEADLALLSLSTAAEYTELSDYARIELGRRGMPQSQIQEAAEIAAIMGMVNSYYSFRHKLNREEYVKNTGLRMRIFSQTQFEEHQFEMLAFAISVYNGCDSCIQGHERALRDLDVSSEKIHDLARFAAVIKGLKILNAA